MSYDSLGRTVHVSMLLLALAGCDDPAKEPKPPAVAPIAAVSDGGITEPERILTRALLGAMARAREAERELEEVREVCVPRVAL